MDYFDRLEADTHHLYEIANEARSKGLDVELETEVPLAKDLAERVEGLVGPEGVAKRIKTLEQDITREEVAFEIAAEIASGKFELTGEKADWDTEQRCDQGLRTALAILTEGVVAAPLEGISDVKIKDNFDGTKYIGVYFAGPIRSAGGTAAALAVLLGDKIRQAIGIDAFKPIDDEIERYVEEVELYESEVTNLQYSPTPEEVRFAANHIPVEVSGEQTDKVEVSHRDLERVETNNIRGGALLAMVEGVIQKSKKIKKISNKLGLDWDWLEEYSKPKKDDSKEDAGDSDIVHEPKYIQDIIGGRPVLGYPSEKGGFRLRYGRSRNTGLATMGVHPATMALLEFLAVGTQLKIEYPGKGNCVVPVDSIEGPTVKLKNGDVLILDTVKQAREVKKDVVEILFLGDMLVAFGEFLRNNQPLFPSGWCEEWWIQLLMRSENFDSENTDLDLHKLEYEYLTAKEAFELSEKYDIPLHPKYTYCYNDVTIKDLNSLIELIEQGKSTFSEDEGMKLDLSYQKRILEIIGVPHLVRDNKIIIDKDHSYSLIKTLTQKLPEKETTLEALNEISKIKIINKAPAYIGTRVGRPEKSKERLMRPAPHGLIPIGNNGGSRRLVATAAKKGSIKVDISRRKCTNPDCGISSFGSLCPKCGSPTEMGNPSLKTIPLAAMLKKASDNVKVRRVDEVKGVVGMISESKLPEPIEKGILRAKHEVFTFKDGTIRHDSTDLPLTHFIPSEIGVTVEKLLEMGYEKDC
ncbi:MAG: DNA polymerase II large subunit, partial [Methanobrevibacter sp.]|nr:DNA polymerase II large subunit [Methanobrevibacter sp.]